MLISIDHGNKQIKTVHKTFTSGLCESETRPPFGQDVLSYNGKYYTLSDQRIPYMRDKTADERFFILTLFAIGFELRRMLPAENPVRVQLCVGLPPAHYGTLYKKFEEYFLGRGVLNFQLGGEPFSVLITEALCFPQAYAAAIPVYAKLQQLPKAVIVDIGGFTADYLQIKYGQADLSVCDSLENGVIVLYNRVKSKINADFDMLLEESDIDAILQDKGQGYDEAVCRIVREQARLFIDDLAGRLRERMIDLRSGKTVFVGGGSILLRKQIEACSKIGPALFVDELSANTKGYELLYRASRFGG